MVFHYYPLSVSIYQLIPLLPVQLSVQCENRIDFHKVAHDSIAELILCNVTLKLRGLKFKTVTSGVVVDIVEGEVFTLINSFAFILTRPWNIL